MQHNLVNLHIDLEWLLSLWFCKIVFFMWTLQSVRNCLSENLSPQLNILYSSVMYLSQMAAKLDLLLCESDTSDVQYVSSRYQHVEDDYLQREILRPSVIVVCTRWVTALFVAPLVCNNYLMDRFFGCHCNWNLQQNLCREVLCRTGLDYKI